MNQRKCTKITAIITALVILVAQLCTSNLFSIQSAAATKTVLWSGNESVSGDWSTWTSAANITISDTSIFDTSFELRVSYTSTAAPILVFQSWSGGEPWTQVGAFYSSNGVAYYTYDSITSELGSGISLVDSISIYPNGADLTVTELAMYPETITDDTSSIHYEGLAGTLVDEMGAGWNLGNTLDSYGDWILEYTDGSTSSFETAWGNPVTTKAIIDAVKAAGFNSIRIPVTWSQHIDDSNGYKIDEDWMDRVQEVVDYAMEDGLICILNVHHDTGTEGWLRATSGSYATCKDKFAAVWTQIADRFEGYSNKLLFEGFNEILNDENNWSYPGSEATSIVNKWNQLFVDTVRSTGGNNASRCLIVNTYCACTNSAVLDDFVLPSDSAENSLIVEVHYYNPYFYCAIISDTTTEDNWKNSGGETTVAGALYGLYQHFTSQGIPVIMGEFGAANKNNTENRVDYLTYVVQTASKYGIKCFYWDEGGTHVADEDYGYFTGFSLFIRNSLTWEFPEIRDALVSSFYDNIIVDNTTETTTSPSPSTEVLVSPSPSTEVSVSPSPSAEVSVSPSPSSGTSASNVPTVTVSTNVGSTVSQAYTVKCTSGTIDLSKVKLCFSYSESDAKAQSFWCDNAGISYQKAPYYTNYTSNVSGTFTTDGLTITLNGAASLEQGDSITIQTRITHADWSSYVNFTPDQVTVYYNNELCQTITF